VVAAEQTCRHAIYYCGDYFDYRDYVHQDLEMNASRRNGCYIDCLVRSHHRGVVVAGLLICSFGRIVLTGQNCWLTLV